MDMYETNNFGLNSIIPILQSKPYNYGWHFLPHDGTVASLNDNVSRIAYLHSKGITNASTLRREGVSIGIGRVKDGLLGLLINAGTTGAFNRKIRIYKRKFNPMTGDYIGPDHKSESHIADMLRYLFTAIHYFWDEKGEFLNSPENANEEYASDVANVTFL
jgi:phage terminase large subunit